MPRFGILSVSSYATHGGSHDRATAPQEPYIPLWALNYEYPSSLTMSFFPMRECRFLILLKPHFAPLEFVLTTCLQNPTPKPRLGRNHLNCRY